MKYTFRYNYYRNSGLATFISISRIFTGIVGLFLSLWSILLVIGGVSGLTKGLGPDMMIIALVCTAITVILLLYSFRLSFTLEDWVYLRSQHKENRRKPPLETTTKERIHSNRAPIFVLCTIIILLCTALVFLALRLHTSMEENSSLQEKVSTYKGAYEYKTSQVESLQSEISSLKDKISESDAELKFWENSAVLVTKTGSKYHRYDCQYVSNTEYWIYSATYALSMGYTPCSVCNPPELPIFGSANGTSGVISRYSGQ